MKICGIGIKVWSLIVSTVLLVLPMVLSACFSSGSMNDQAYQSTLDGIVSLKFHSMTLTKKSSDLLPAKTGLTITETPIPTGDNLFSGAKTGTQQITPTKYERLDPKYWSEWPIVPPISGRALQIYRNGIASGNNPKIFSTIGDCQSEPNVFLGIYATDRYFLGEGYTYLEETIEYFHDSFQMKSQGVRDGLSAPSALTSIWADPLFCNKGENPVQCELRLHKPGIVFINLGTNWKPGASADLYEEYLRKIVDSVIMNGSIPVLSTKADNVEGDHSLNRATARIAYDYDIPLWNFWLAAQSLPNNGLDGNRDNIYLTPDGWNRRNFTALQVLDAIRRSALGE